MSLKLNPTSIIQKKRDGKELTEAEIRKFIHGVTTGEIVDYQTAAFLMAIYFRGMSLDETVALTQAMLESGNRYDLSKIPGPKVDKHSTGGVGDKTSLILVPLAAACGLKVPMMSGRGLGHSGGTLDKLESIAGFNIHLKPEEFEAVLNQVGCAMIGQSHQMVPADKKLYALRDVTGTVECIPLIAASILSKKLAEGAEALVLDVKVGSGAFMKTKQQARKLVKTMLQVSKRMHLPCRALLTDMSQPLGYAVGNALEVTEAIEVLRNQKLSKLNPHCRSEINSSDLKELVIQLCAHMLELGKLCRNLADGRKLAHQNLSNGSAWKTFQELIQIQKGSLEQIQNPKKLLHSSETLSWTAKKRGYIVKINTEVIGKTLVELGGGRKKINDSIDPRVGLIFYKKLGSHVQLSEPIASVYPGDKTNSNQLAILEAQFDEAIEISNARKPVPKLILERY